MVPPPNLGARGVCTSAKWMPGFRVHSCTLTATFGTFSHFESDRRFYKSSAGEPLCRQLRDTALVPWWRKKRNRYMASSLAIRQPIGDFRFPEIEGSDFFFRDYRKLRDLGGGV
jgi:hypothetical protein